MRIVVTGIGGFIGYHLCKRLVQEGHEILGIDNLNAYYDQALKVARLQELGLHLSDIPPMGQKIKDKQGRLSFYRVNLENKDSIEKCLSHFKPNIVCHLAAQAGVRYSLEHPHSYIDSNVTGFLNILELARSSDFKHLVYASSSSVYGLNKKMPLSEADPVDHPVSLYAATKRANELMAHTYSHLYGIPTTGLRFFTVYGPWGRPDMALFKFTKAILNETPIDIYNHGDMYRDFTYIDDIVDGVYRVIHSKPLPQDTDKPDRSSCPFRIYNIGNNRPVHLMDFIEVLEDKLGQKAKKRFVDMQPGDVFKTSSNLSNIENDLGYVPKTSLTEGISAFVDWYRDFYMQRTH